VTAVSAFRAHRAQNVWSNRITTDRYPPPRGVSPEGLGGDTGTEAPVVMGPFPGPVAVILPAIDPPAVTGNMYVDESEI
jgi:hypothetical protein